MTLHVESFGAGPPLVLLHGWAMHSGLWGPLLPKLAGHFRVHAVDLPGHGYSPALAPYSLPGIVDAVAGRFAALEEAPAVLGWSLGGAVALAWALREPNSISRLVLTGTTPCFVKRADWPHAMDAETLRRFGDELSVSYRYTLQRFVSLQVQGSGDARAVLSALRGQLFARGEPSRATLQDGLALLATTDLRDRVPEIGIPALVIAGDRDALTPWAAGAWLAGALPRGRFTLEAGAAHAPFLSHTERFAAHVLEFAE